LVIFINGILTLPRDTFGWTDRAERWFLEHSAHDVDSLEYFSSPLLGLFGEGKRVRQAVELLSGYLASFHAAGLPAPKLHLVTHSRGAEIARRLIVDCGFPIASLHAFAPAIGTDLQASGLLNALRAGRLKRLRIYRSRGDSVLRWVAGAAAVVGLYGRLGYSGPANVPEDLEKRIRVVARDELGHSTWFAPGHFTWSMEEVAADLDELPL
jgi:hypothetical protein